METFNIIFGNPLIALFVIVGVGLLFGSVSVKGINLGSSGVLFAALLAGHLGLAIPAGVGQFGLVLFVYCVGIGAGPRFFPAFAREGGGLAKLGFVIVAIGAFIAWSVGKLFHLPADLTAGLFAGALTSTPALAAATEGAKGMAEEVAIGYGIAYPFGVIGVVLFVQLLPKLLKNKGAEEVEENDEESKLSEVENVFVEVANPSIEGDLIGDSSLRNLSCQISRIVRDGRLQPLHSDDRFEKGQILLIVGQKKDIDFTVSYIGKLSEKSFVIDTDHERQKLVVTKKTLGGMKMSELSSLRDFGVSITRITRLGYTFVPSASTKIETYDVLTSVGLPEGLKKFSKHIGHRAQAFDQTDLISLALGLSAGILLGMMPIGLPGSTPMTLGLAGGPLFVSLILGYFGKVGPVVGHIPRPTRLLLQELGLVLFLANAGIVGGSKLAVTVAEYGPIVFVAGALITLVPMLISYPLARKMLGLSPNQVLGGICGGMTSTPALGALTASNTSQQPIISYATAYPIALIMMTVLAKILIQILAL